MSKRFLYAVICVLILVIVGLLTHETTTSILHKPDKSGLVKNFGNLKKRDIQKTRFTFNYINKSYSKMNVYGVIDACDCTKSTVALKTYHQNDTIKISTKYDPFKYKDLGKVEKQMFLVTNKKVSKFDTIFPLILEGVVEE